MNFNVLVTRSVKEKIASWDIGNALACQIYIKFFSHLDHCDPESGRAIVAPVRWRVFQMIVSDPVTGLDYDLCTWVDEHKLPGTRYVMDVDLQPLPVKPS